jgi:hypothetical protein
MSYKILKNHGGKMMFLTVHETEAYLKNQVAEKTSPEEIWGIFKRFGEIEIENEDDIELLFQCGMEEKLFYLEFLRQFTVYDLEEYSHMEQLHCQLFFDPTKELTGLTISEWYFETEGDIEGYFKHIETLQEFTIPIKLSPVKIIIFQEKI